MQISLRHVDDAVHSHVFRFFAFLTLSLFALLAAFVALSLYEWAVFGESSLGVGKPPSFTPYYLGRLLLAFLLSLLVVSGLFSLRDETATRRREISPGKSAVVYGLLVVAVACTALFVIDPNLFYEVCLEDGAMEWASALIPLAASGMFVYAFIRVRRAEPRDAHRRVALVLIPLFAFVLFVTAMEEISWMQRVFGIATPAMFEGNQQREMNFHNMHSIIIGSTHKMVVFAGLVLLPFIAEIAPKNRLSDLFADFLPSRFVLAASAPLAGFHYNEWNFFASPITVFVTLVILACYIKAAKDRGDRMEMTLFSALAAFVAVAQPVYLALGHRFVRTWDASEYMELFMAIGLFLYTWETVGRVLARHGMAPGQVSIAQSRP